MIDRVMGAIVTVAFVCCVGLGGYLFSWLLQRNADGCPYDWTRQSFDTTDNPIIGAAGSMCMPERHHE